MRSKESEMTFDRWDILFVALGASAVYFLLAYRRVLPSIQSVQDLANVVNTKGGNILVLFVLTNIFFGTGVGMVYWAMNRQMDGKLTNDNAVMMMGLSWIMGTAFGGAFSAMLKVMSGDDPKPPPGTTTTSSTTSATTPVKPETTVTSTTSVVTAPDTSVKPVALSPIPIVNKEK